MIYIEDQIIKLGGVVLPGLVKSIEVTETAKVDEQEVEGSTARPKQATGYEDAKINIELVIDDTPSETKYQRYATLRSVFRVPGQAVPQPVSIVSEDTAAHGIEKVIFKKLTHKGENKKDQLTASLELWEFIPQTITAVTDSSGGGSKKAGSPTGTGDSGGTDAGSGLTEEYKSYLETRRGKSPAVDRTASPEAVDRIAQMPY
ncbi:MAG: transcriptional regulator [Lachnospiraceae bacterium]|jgi:hypothetical protein|nr:transcriptional regulator [Lachnospiraceae bacterium]